MSQWIAYVDESVRLKAGAYLMAATCIDVRDLHEARAAVATLVKPGHRFHWRLSTRPAQTAAVSLIAELPVLHLVAVASPLNQRRQERARRYCLRRLLPELAAHGVNRVVMESRTRSLNAKDAQALDALRAAKVIGPGIMAEHGYPAGPTGDPLLWVPDIVAGAIGAELDRGDSLAGPLVSVVTRYIVSLD